MSIAMVRPLSKEMQKIAIEELYEVPERVEDDIKHIQEWVKQQPHLNAPTDKQWILGFLRGSKFSLQITKYKIDLYYTLKNLVPELLKPIEVCSIEIQTYLKAGLMLPLPFSKNYAGPRVMLVRLNNYDSNIMNIENMTVFFSMVLNILMIEDDNLMVSGVIFWIDMKHYPLSLIFQLTPTYLKTLLSRLQKAFPLRIKGFIGSGSPAIAYRVVNLVKVYMEPKLRNRVFLYTEDNFEDIHKIIVKDLMPKEYGGRNSNVEDIKDYWIKKVESYSIWFAESDQYCTNEALRPGKPSTLSENVGIDGSFRILNID